MRKLYTILLILALAITTSCHHEHFEADLVVHVKGFISGKPKVDRAVAVFETRADAEEEYYAVTPWFYTDSHGEVFIYGLDVGRKYYVRVEGLILTNIKSTNRLDEGTNFITVRL